MNENADIENIAIVQSDPIAVLKYEHQMALLRLETIERTLQYLESLPRDSASERIELEQARLKEGVISLERVIDHHFHKEEEALFPVLAEYIGKEHGPIELMLYEHNQLRSTFCGWRKSVSDLCDNIGPKRDSILRFVTTSGYEAIQLLRLHIRKENQILFEICEASLSSDEKKEIAKKIKTM